MLNTLCHVKHNQIMKRIGLNILAAMVTLGGDQQVHGEAAMEQHAPDSDWSLHGQATTISQRVFGFRSPYEGLNSLSPSEPFRSTVTATVFLGYKPFYGTELYVNPEMSGGKGLSGTTGAGGFPNGEATRVGNAEISPYIARLFLRQTFDLDRATEKVTVESDKNQIAGSRSTSALRFTVGKLSTGDLFDNNSFSHDARTQFMNWSLMANGAWDYPADTRGYTWGGAVEWLNKGWALRAGAFAMPKEANGSHFDHKLGQASGSAVEFERSFRLGEHPGVARFEVFLNFAHMGTYKDSISLNQSAPDIEATRRYTSKYGFAVNAEQEICHDLGAFVRAGWNDGKTETWAFTEIDETFSAGLSLKGGRWERPNDVLGLAGVINGLSPDHRDYLAHGGYGFIVGDGQLSYGTEKIIETYYSCRVISGVFVTADYQFIHNPGYNRDRGPASLATIRVHGEF